MLKPKYLCLLTGINAGECGWRRSREIHRVIQSLPRAAAKKMDADIVKQIELRSLHQTFRRLVWPDSPIMLQCSQTEIIKTPIIRRSNFVKIRRHDDFTQRLPKMKPPMPDSMRQKTVDATLSFGLRNAFPAGLLNESYSMIRPALQ
jgi:hypothetical protein